MKNKLLILSAIFTAALLCSCEKNDPQPTIPTDQGQTTKPVASFEYTIQPDYKTVVFRNTSVGLVDYSWNFGDGKKSTEKNPIHTYPSAEGVYHYPTLTGHDENGQEYTCRQEIYLTMPQSVQVYVTGYTLYKIPYQNKPYCIAYELYDKDENWKDDWNTLLTPKLSNSNLPYSYNFTNQPHLEYIENSKGGKCLIYVYWGEDYTQCLCQPIAVNDILGSRKTEYILTSNNGSTKVGIKLRYE